MPLEPCEGAVAVGRAREDSLQRLRLHNDTSSNEQRSNIAQCDLLEQCVFACFFFVSVSVTY